MNKDLRLELLEFLEAVWEDHYLSARNAIWLKRLIAQLKEN